MQIAVIGAGTMGRSISSYIASCDHQVILLDMPSNDNTNRNNIVQNAIDSLKQEGSTLISHPNKIKNIKIGNLEDDIALLRNCDLVIEAIVEKLEVKLDLFDKITKFLNPNCVIASNTSTLSLSLLKSRKAWPWIIILHFFNPVRYLKLVELVVDDSTSKQTVGDIEKFLTHGLGRSVVKCNDSPGFVANRIGCFFLELALQKASIKMLNLHTIDFLANKFLGMPKTGIFGLYDLIGLDVMYLIGKSFTEQLPDNDEYHSVYSKQGIIKNLIDKGFLGIKSESGFYKKTSTGKQVLDIPSMDYSEIILDNNLDIFDTKNLQNPYRIYFEELIYITYHYAKSLIPKVVNNMSCIDEVLNIGFNWKYGLSGLAKKLSIISSEENSEENKVEIENNHNYILRNQDSSVKYHKNALVFTLTNKLGLLTWEVFELLNKAIDMAMNQNKTLILQSGKHFSVGMDLNFIISHISNKNWQVIENFLLFGQQTMQKLKNASVVSIAQNYALGGGCELLLHSYKVIAGIELQGGLVETSLGLIPSWGGLKEMILRSKGNKSLFKKLISNILFGKKTASVDYFQEDYLVDIQKVVYSKDMLNKAAEISFRTLASAEIQNYNTQVLLCPFNVEELFPDLKGPQKYIANQINGILKNDSLSVSDLLAKEREIFMSLVRAPDITSRISQILK